MQKATQTAQSNSTASNSNVLTSVNPKDASHVQVPDSLSEIAAMIRADWKNVYFGAEPYLDALSVLQSIHDEFGADSASTIVRYFLGNATKWRGPVARAVKAKLNELLKKVR